MRIVIAGNIFDGYKFFGPFSDIETSIEWAEEFIATEWFTAKLEPPEGIDSSLLFCNCYDYDADVRYKEKQLFF